MKTIASLDDLSLLDIFNRIPLTHLKTAGRVCTRWYAFRAMSASTRRNLELYFSPTTLTPSGAPPNIGKTIPFWDQLVHDDGTKMYPKVARKSFDALQLCELSMDFAQFLANVLPNVKHLSVVINGAESCRNIKPLIYLLKSWNLISLTFNAKYDKSKFKPYQGKSFSAHFRLFATINPTTLPSLKSLEFYYNGGLSTESMDLSILVQLEHFSFSSVDTCDDTEMQALETFCQTNDQLKQIWLNLLYIDIDNLLRFSPELAHKFASLVIPPLDHEQFASFCSRFNNLTALKLLITLNINRETLFGALETMPQLVCLKLDIFDGIFLENLVPVENAKQPTLSTLKVCVLKRISYLPTHKVFQNLALHLLMPNLQVFHLDRKPLFCRECVANGMRSKYKTICLTEMVNPIRGHCKKLRLLNTTYPNTNWDLTNI